MREPEGSTPPPAPRWVWVILIVVVLAALAMVVTHLFLGNPMKRIHGSAAPTIPSAVASA